MMLITQVWNCKYWFKSVRSNKHQQRTQCWAGWCTWKPSHNRAYLCYGDYLTLKAPAAWGEMWREVLLKSHKTSQWFLMTVVACFITCWFTSVDPVWVCNAGYCKDICCQKEAPWNDREFIHIFSWGSSEWREKNVVVVQMWPSVERHRVGCYQSNLAPFNRSLWFCSACCSNVSSSSKREPPATNGSKTTHKSITSQMPAVVQ